MKKIAFLAVITFGMFSTAYAGGDCANGHGPELAKADSENAPPNSEITDPLLLGKLKKQDLETDNGLAPIVTFN